MNAQKGGQSAIKLFLKENKTLAFSLPVLFVLLIVVIIIYSTGGGNPAAPVSAEGSAGQTQTIEILPDTERSDRSSNVSTNNGTYLNSDSNSNADIGSANVPTKNPFSGPIILTGVLTDSSGDDIAVIEANNKSYIVKKGDTLEDSMTVSEVSSEEVILKNGDREIALKLEKRKNSQTVIN